MALASTLSRVFCGIVFVVHGTPKIMNLEATAEWFGQLGFPAWVAIPVALFEFFGGLVLIIGVLTRIVASLFIVEMAVAAFQVHLPHGFDVFRFGDPSARGYGYNLALIVLLMVVILLGPGDVSLDGIRGRRGRVPPPDMDDGGDFDES
jgi:putative oxidoreductase